MSKPLTSLYGSRKNRNSYLYGNSKNTIIIDNSPYNTNVNPNNSILVPNYEIGNENDVIFKELIQWLNKLHCKDIRKCSKPKFNKHNNVDKSFENSFFYNDSKI